MAHSSRPSTRAWRMWEVRIRAAAGPGSPPISPSTLPRKAASHSGSRSRADPEADRALVAGHLQGHRRSLVAFGKVEQGEDLGIPSLPQAELRPLEGRARLGPGRSALVADRLAQVIPHGPQGRLPLEEQPGHPSAEDHGQQEAGPEQRGQFGPASRPLAGAFEGAGRPGQDRLAPPEAAQVVGQLRGRGVAPRRAPCAGTSGRSSPGRAAPSG